MRIVQIAAIGASMLFLACAGSQPVQTEQKKLFTKTNLDKEQLKPYMQKGNNTIKGQAFLRQQGGGVVTCAGQVVFLIPATPYYREVVRSIAGNTSLDLPTIDVRSTKGDAQGNFTFSDLPDGNWFVVTLVTWTVAYQRQGGHLMQEMRVSNGETKQVLITETDRFGD